MHRTKDDVVHGDDEVEEGDDAMVLIKRRKQRL